VQPHSRAEARKTLSWSSLPLQSRTASRLPALRYRRTHLRGCSVLSSPGIASPGVLAPLEHIDVGCPSSHPPRTAPSETVARSREGEDYQALTGAVLRVLAPLDGSGCTRGTHDQPLAELLAVRRGAPTLRGLVPCRSRPLESPYRAFPSRGAVPALAGPFSLVSSLGLPNGAVRSEGFAAPFAERADLSPQPARRPAGLKKPGRRFPGVARASHVSRCRGRLRRLVSERPGSPDSAARTLTSELYSPRESVRG